VAVFTAKLICATDKFHAFITIYAECADTAQTDRRVSTTHSHILSRLLLLPLANLMCSSLKPFIWASCSTFCWSVVLTAKLGYAEFLAMPRVVELRW